MAAIKDLWEGIEIEGRLFGMKTLFVGEFPDLDQLKLAIVKYPHVFFNPAFLRKFGFDIVVWAVSQTYCTVCIESTMLPFVPDVVRDKAHLMLTLSVPAAGLLKPTDSVRICYHPEPNNKVIEFGSFIETDTTMYALDQNLEAI